MGRPRQRAQARHQYNRTDRISETIREIVATELERLGDERVDMVTVTGVTVDNDLNTAKVFYSALTAEAEGRVDEVAESLDEIRWPIQRVVNGAIRARKTPQIVFLPDDVLAAALRIDDIIAHRVLPAGEDVDGTGAAPTPPPAGDGPESSAAQRPQVGDPRPDPS